MFEAGSVPYFEKPHLPIPSGDAMELTINGLPTNIRKLFGIVLKAKKIETNQELLNQVDDAVGKCITAILETNAQDIAKLLLEES